MILLARPSAATRRLAGHEKLGLLATPRGPLAFADLHPHLLWAADNDAFAGFHEGRFLGMLEDLTGLLPAPRWVACPDVWGDSAATLSLLDAWAPAIERRGLPVALVAQDGLTPAQVPWGRIACLFVGGSDGWRGGPAAEVLVREAKRRGKWVHIGRAQTLRKLRTCARWGADSVDGTCTARLPDLWVPKLLGWIARCLAEQAAPSLFAKEAP